MYFSYRKLNKSKNTSFDLEDLTFTIPKNKFHIFIGENGAGKSTTMKILVGALQNYSGKLLFRNIDVKQNYNAKLKICFIPDKAVFPNNINLYNYLFMTTSLVDSNKHKVKKYIQMLTKRYELTEHLKKNPNKLSAGQKKKVLLIQAILMNAELIILDEPAANLDPTTRLLFFNDLKKLQIKRKCTIFLSSHIIDEVSKYADYVTFIKKGKILLSTNVEYPEQVIQFYNQYYLEQKIQTEFQTLVDKNLRYYFIKKQQNNILVCNTEFLIYVNDNKKDPKIFLEFKDDFKIYNQDLVIYEIDKNNNIKNIYYCSVFKIDILNMHEINSYKDFEFIFNKFNNYEFIICLHLYKFRQLKEPETNNIDKKLLNIEYLDFRTINNGTI